MNQNICLGFFFLLLIFLFLLVAWQWNSNDVNCFPSRFSLLFFFYEIVEHEFGYCRCTYYVMLLYIVCPSNQHWRSIRHYLIWMRCTSATRHNYSWFPVIRSMNFRSWNVVKENTKKKYFVEQNHFLRWTIGAASANQTVAERKTKPTTTNKKKKTASGTQRRKCLTKQRKEETKYMSLKKNKE